MSIIPILQSIKIIEKQYMTGDLPVLVACSDKNMYICKYMRSSVGSFKLVSEFIGSQFANVWGIYSPPYAFVWIKQEHWSGINTSHSVSAPCWGYMELVGTVDVTSTTCFEINPTSSLLKQLMKIALFDFWIANEDRTYNNANMLYDMINQRLVSIDYGGILNTSTYDYSLSQLTSTDTILYADIFMHLKKCMRIESIKEEAEKLKVYYDVSIEQSRNSMEAILRQLPKEWNVCESIIEAKMKQLFELKWLEGVWENFLDCLTENLER